MITKNAIKLIELIGQEYALQLDRVGSRYIPADKLMPITIERLQLKAKSNKDLQIFLETLADIPAREDEVGTYRWAKDPREPDELNTNRAGRDQRARDEDLGLVPEAVHTVPNGI